MKGNINKVFSTSDLNEIIYEYLQILCVSLSLSLSTKYLALISN